MQSLMTNRFTPLLVMTTFAMATVALGAYAYKTITTGDAWSPMTISVNGSAEVMAVPDIATFTLAVRADGDDVATAQTSATEKNNAIIAFLTGAGVAEADIKTTAYSISPRFRFEQRPCTPVFCPPSESIEDGFEVYQALEVKVRDTAQAGTLLAGVGTAGATDISGLTFTIDDPSTFEAEARAEAIKDAQVKAEALAESLGVRLGDLVSFYEEQPMGPTPYYGMGGDAMLRSAEMAAAPEIPMGENEIVSRVSLTYKVK